MPHYRHLSVHVVYTPRSGGQLMIWTRGQDNIWHRRAVVHVSSPVNRWDLDCFLSALDGLLQEQLALGPGYQGSLEALRADVAPQEDLDF